MQQTAYAVERGERHDRGDGASLGGFDDARRIALRVEGAENENVERGVVGGLDAAPGAIARLQQHRGPQRNRGQVGKRRHFGFVEPFADDDPAH